MGGSVGGGGVAEPLVSGRATCRVAWASAGEAEPVADTPAGMPALPVEALQPESGYAGLAGVWLAGVTGVGGDCGVGVEGASRFARGTPKRESIAAPRIAGQTIR